jgi:orotate phosphoribosyltransferase
VQEVEQTLRVPVTSIVKLEDLIDMLEEEDDHKAFLAPILEYRKKFGVNG